MVICPFAPYGFAHWPKTCQIKQHFGQTLQNPYLWNLLYTIWSSMDLHRPVIVQHHGHLTLTLDFQGQVLKMLYLRNGRVDWHGMKGMWVDRILDPHCDFELWPHPWPWPLIFKVKLWKSSNSGMGCPTDMEQKGCESTEYWTHVVTQVWPHPWSWPWIFSIKFWNSCIPGMRGPIVMERKGYELMRCYAYLVTLSYDLDLERDVSWILC